MAVVVFDPTAFKVRYPEFGAVSDARLTAFFGDTCLYLSNENCSPVQNVQKRTRLLWMLTAHLAYLGGALSADGQARPFGQVTQATEGGVSAALAAPPPSAGSQMWYMQTQYGADFWYATSNLRGFQYVAQPTRY